MPTFSQRPEKVASFVSCSWHFTSPGSISLKEWQKLCSASWEKSVYTRRTEADCNLFRPAHWLYRFTINRLQSQCFFTPGDTRVRMCLFAPVMLHNNNTTHTHTKLPKVQATLEYPKLNRQSQLDYNNNQFDKARLTVTNTEKIRS